MADDTQTAPPEAPEPALSPEEQAIADAQEQVAEAQANVDRLAKQKALVEAAHAKLAEAKDTHAAAVEAAQPKPEPEKHMFVDVNATGNYEQMEYPAGGVKSYRLTVQGVNVEHVGEDAHGCWLYRGM